MIIFAAVALAAVNAQIPGFGSCPDYKPVADFDIKRVSIFCTTLRRSFSSVAAWRDANASPRAQFNRNTQTTTGIEMPRSVGQSFPEQFALKKISNKLKTEFIFPLFLQNLKCII